GGGKEKVDLPITFEDTATVDYALVDFGGNASSIVVDPTDPDNLVGQAIKTDMSELWAGTTMGDNGLASVIPFQDGETKMSVRVWSPDAGIPVRVKVEDATNAAISVETEAMTTTAAAWETLEFDFNNQADGTAAINFNNTYDKISIFFNFGTTGAEAGEKTYYWDDTKFIGGGGGGSSKDQIDLPITFEDTATVDYNLVDFGGNASSIIVDPTDPDNLVGQAIKTDMSELWAGTTMGDDGLLKAIPFAAGATKMSVRVWSPDAGIPIRIKVEDATNAAISVETETSTTVAMAWETIELDFANQADGTAAIDFANTYDKISIFFNFGTTGAEAGEKTYYWDDVEFIGSGKAQVDLPITFEDTATVDYALIDFGGNASSIVVDPTDSDNLVGQTIKTDVSELWAGTTMGINGLASAIPFGPGATKITIRVWSPDAGIPVRLKVEDAKDPSISVETETATTTAMAWETIELDFANQATGTAPIDFANTYDKISVFFNFGTTGIEAGEKTYYWDDVQFIGNGKEQVDLPITFQDTANVDHAMVDFGGNVSDIVADPTDPDNIVARIVKTTGAETWAGTTVGDFGLANAIPFAMNNTKMNIRVWTPDAGIPVRIKVEDANDTNISVETEAMTTVTEDWEVLEFDFTNQADGTAAIDFNNSYSKISVFFNFGTGGTDAGEKTYFLDDIIFGGVTSVDVLDAAENGIRVFPNPTSNFFQVEFEETLNETVQLTLFDLNGKLLKAVRTIDQISRIDVNDVTPGMYFLRIEKDNVHYFQKLMIAK
ncbi:MAG: T9SS type A sorting domain-containing protein, partial [Bacteroidota bacterium]